MKISPMAALGCLLIVAACESPTGSGSGAKSLTSVLTAADGFVYYDLATGSTVADPGTQDWDLALSFSTGGVRTNSGATADDLESGGAGGVYYADTHDFNAVSSYDAGHFSDAYAVDTTKYANVVTGSDPETHAPIFTVLPTVLNQMTKLEYDGEGTEEDPFSTPSDENGPLPSVYEGPAYYTYDAGVTSASGEVYVVRHGDGTHYAKVQIVSMTLSGDSTTRTRVVKYKNF